MIDPRSALRCGRAPGAASQLRVSGRHSNRSVRQSCESWRVTSYRPRLRAHLHVAEGQLDDWLLHRKLVLDETVAAVVGSLDGVEEWTTIRATLIDAGHDGAEVDDALRACYCLHAVEGAGDELAAKLERVVTKAEIVPTSILEGARFACQGSGQCCSGYSFGPLSDADIATLDGLDLATSFPHVAAPYYETNEAGRYLRKAGDQCVFLNGERRCGLHAAFGAASKPHFCRLYPLDSFGTLEGVRVVDRGTCATFGVSARTGLPLADDVPLVRELFGPATLHHPMVFVDGQGWDYSLYLRFTTAATDLIKRNRGTAGETLHAIGRCLDALALAVMTCPLEPGQPDDVVSRVLAASDEAWYRSPELYAGFRAVRSLGTVLRELAVAADTAIVDGRAVSSAGRYRELIELVEYTADAIALYDGTPIAPPPPAGPDVDEALRLSLRQQLFGRNVLVGGLAGAGLVRIGLIQLLALAGARRQAGARPLTAADVSYGHMIAVRSLHPEAAGGFLTLQEEGWRELLDGILLASLLVQA